MRKKIRNCQMKIKFAGRFRTDMTEWCVFWERNCRGCGAAGYKEQKELEEKRRMEQMPKGSVLKHWNGNEKVRWKINSVRKIKQNTEEWRFKIMKKQIYDEKTE